MPVWNVSTVFHDFDRDGTRDAGDVGLAGFIVYLDLDNDSVLDTNEQRVISDTNGNYTFANVGAGTYKIRIALQTNYIQTLPANNFGRNATLATSSSVATGKDFGVDN